MRVTRVTPATKAPKVAQSPTVALGSLYILERSNGKRETFHAKDDESAIRRGKEILGLHAGASDSLFRRAGGKHIRYHASGQAFYPPKLH